MIKFAKYNPIQFNKSPIPHSDWEIKDCFVQEFVKGTTNQFLIKNININFIEYQLRIFRCNNTVVSQVVRDINTIINLNIPNETGYFFAEISFATARRPTRWENIMYSKIFKVVEPSENFLTLSAINKTNRNGIWIGFKPFLNLEFEAKDKSEIRTNSTQFEQSHGRKIVLDAETYNVRAFVFGGKRGVSRYLANVINAWLYCDVIEVNGERWKIVSEPELLTLDNYDNISVRCEMVRDSDFGMWEDGSDIRPIPIPLPIPTPEPPIENVWDDNRIWNDNDIWID